MTPRYDLAIFDFDGTLADSAGWFFGKLNGIARQFGFREVDEAELAELRGMRSAEILRRIGLSHWKLPRIATHMRKLAAQEAHLIRPFPGVDALLERLAGSGVTLAIVTSNTEANVRTILGAQNAARFSYYACGASLFGKAPKFRAVARKLRVPRTRVIAIGDEVRDIDAARKAGLAVGAVGWGMATGEILRACGPDHYFASVEEIGAAIVGDAPAAG